LLSARKKLNHQEHNIKLVTKAGFDVSRESQSFLLGVPCVLAGKKPFRPLAMAQTFW
jgi:hypothetical protein